MMPEQCNVVQTESDDTDYYMLYSLLKEKLRHVALTTKMR